MAGSPWGTIQHSTKVKRGFRVVSTAGHGGAMITKKFAKANLSEACIQRGTLYSGYLCYEEDCDMVIPLFEVRDCWEKLWPGKEMEQSFLSSLSNWNSDYLLEVGIEPVKK